MSSREHVVPASPSEPGVVACFGEVLLRLSALEGELLLQSWRLQAALGGAEANVAVALAHLGHTTRMLSALPDTALGDQALGELRRHGVDTQFVLRRPGRMGLYFLTPGRVLRPSQIIYDRAHSVFAETAHDAYDFTLGLKDCAWLHLSGVTPAVGPVAAEAALAAAQAAKAMGVRLSFDGNYRAKMWAAWDGDARAILRALVDRAEIFFGDDRDIALILGLSFDQADPVARRTAAATAAFDAFPHLHYIASTLRVEHTVDRQALGGFLATREAVHIAPPVQLEGIVDRIGAGDAFASGVLHGLITGEAPAQALRLGQAAGAYKHSVAGDVSCARPQDLDDAMVGGLHVRR